MGGGERKKSVRKGGDINSTLKTLIMILEEALIYNHPEENVDIELPVYLGWLSRRIAEGQKPDMELFRKFEALYRENRIIKESPDYTFKRYGRNRFPPEHWWYVD